MLLSRLSVNKQNNPSTDVIPPPPVDNPKNGLSPPHGANVAPTTARNREDLCGRSNRPTNRLFDHSCTGEERYGDDWSTQAGEVEAPDTTFTHRSGTVGDTNTDVYYRVKAEDMHGNRSALSDEAYGEKEFGTNGSGKKKAGERQER